MYIVGQQDLCIITFLPESLHGTSRNQRWTRPWVRIMTPTRDCLQIVHMVTWSSHGPSSVQTFCGLHCSFLISMQGLCLLESQQFRFLQPWTIRDTGPPCRVGTKISPAAARTKPRIWVNTSLQHLIAPCIETHMHNRDCQCSRPRHWSGLITRTRRTRQAVKCPNITPGSPVLRAFCLLLMFTTKKAR